MKLLNPGYLVSLFIVGTLLNSVSAETPPAFKLLPRDTLAVITVPDFQSAKASYSESSWVQLWKDPSMVPFRDKFLAKLTTEMIEPLEKSLGIKWVDYKDLFQGQITFALVQNGWNGVNEKMPSWLLVVDAGEKEALLKAKLDEMQAKLVDSGQPLKTESIRDTEFHVIPMGEKGNENNPLAQAYIGKSATVLLASNSPELLTGVMARQFNSGAGALDDVDIFQSDYQSWLRGNALYGWVNFTPIQESLERMGLAWQKTAGPNPMMPPADKLFESLGFRGVKSLSFATRESEKGSFLEMNIGAPVSERKGLVEILAGNSRESGPMPFIGDNVVTFGRSRIDGQKLWDTLEKTLAEVSPQLNGILQLSLGALGKDKDPNFDFKQGFIKNLGNDWITWQGATTDDSIDALVSPPTMYLLGSPNPKQFVEAIKVAMGFVLPPGSLELKEREFLGRTVYELPLPPSVNPLTGEPIYSSLNFTSAQGYAAFSTDRTMLETYLRNEIPGSKPLIQKSGLRQAIDEIGGSNSGWFGFQNDKAIVRSLFALVKNNPNLLDSMFSMVPAGEGGNGADAVREWVDLSLLPEFNQVSRYFGFSVYNGIAQDKGLRMKYFNPVPRE